MKKGISSSLFDLYLCCCHTQQLAVLDTFKEFHGDSLGVTLLSASNTCKRLAAHLHKSNIGKLLLEEECKETGHNPKVIPQSNDTRWDSRYSNMEGVQYHQDCLLRLARKGKLKVKVDKQVVSLVPSIEEFELIDTGVQVLKICRDTTKVFEQEKVPTLPLVVERLYNMDCLLKELQENKGPQIRDFCEALRENLSSEDRFPNFGMENTLNCMANYLNPTLAATSSWTGESGWTGSLKQPRDNLKSALKSGVSESFSLWISQPLLTKQSSWNLQRNSIPQNV